MQHEFSRTELLIGRNALKKLMGSTVAIFGIGGVGAYAAEGLARCGVGKFVLIDDDKICLTNINRQLHATRMTIGRSKTEVMKERILDINPKAEVVTHETFYTPELGDELISAQYDYIIDAVDTVTAKIDIIMRAKALGIPIVSCMGAGNKLDPTRFEVADIYSTSVCPLAKVMRKELKKRGIEELKVVYSKEEPILPNEDSIAGCKKNCICPKNAARNCITRRQIPGSISFVPSVAGLIMVGEAVKELIDL